MPKPARKRTSKALPVEQRDYTRAVSDDRPKQTFKDRVRFIIREKRQQHNLTLEELARRATAIAQGETRITTAHMSRIENGWAEPSPLQLKLLMRVLNYDVSPLFVDKVIYPWYAIRPEKAEALLADVIADKFELRRDKAHERAIKEKLYQYVPLRPIPEVPDYIANGEVENLRDPIMQGYLFHIGSAEVTSMRDLMDSHENSEEVIYCIEGEIEFWRQHSDTEQPQRCVLTPGTFLHFFSDMRHGFRALGPKPAKALFVGASRPAPPQHHDIELKPKSRKK